MTEERVVLIADDSLVVRTLLRSQLREDGYRVVEAADGEQALARAAEIDPDVILLDIEMPRLDGFTVIRELKRDPRLSEVPIVLITGRTSTEDVVRGLELGAQDYLRKPFEAAELSARVQAAVRTKRLQDELRSLNQDLEALAGSDQLTGLGNRRLLDEELARACARAARHDLPLALLLIDADHFKHVNDTYGHHVGDEALRALADRLAERKRNDDVLGRWGGEEFLLLATGTDAEGAHALAEALRAHVEARPLRTSSGHFPLTVSIGWATFRGELHDMLRRADAAIYAAKQRGRNRTESGDEQR